LELGAVHVAGEAGDAVGEFVALAGFVLDGDVVGVFILVGVLFWFESV
jgi:hypothetical protein